MTEFGFTYDTDISNFKKFQGTFEIEKVLNEKIKLADYSTNIQEIVFVYIAVDTQKFNGVDNFIKFRRKSKTIELGVNLPYYEFINADKDKELKILKNAYIEGVETLLSKRKDIDYKKLSENIRQIF